MTWLPWALLSAVFAALTAILAKLGLQSINSDLALLVRTAVVMVSMTAIVTATGQWQSLRDVDSRNWCFLILSGLATGASWLCYFRALQLGDAARVAPVDKLSVVLVAIFAVIFLHERLTLLQWGGILLVCAGVILISLQR